MFAECVCTFFANILTPLYLLLLYSLGCGTSLCGKLKKTDISMMLHD